MMFSNKVKVLFVLVLAMVCFGCFSVALADDAASEVLDLVNAQREAEGLRSLKLNESLNRVAELRAKELAQSWSHTRPDGSQWNTAFADAGVTATYRGENLGKGQSSSQQVVGDWMGSQGHKDNILNSRFHEMGVASVVIDGTTYWVQVFAEDVEGSDDDEPRTESKKSNKKSNKTSNKTSSSSKGSSANRSNVSAASKTSTVPANSTVTGTQRANTPVTAGKNPGL